MVAVDAAGATAVVRKWDFKILPPPVFHVSAEWDPGSMNASGYVLPIYELNKNYRITAPRMPKSQLFEDTLGPPEEVSYMLRLYNSSNVESRCPGISCPGGFYVDSSGSIFVSPELVGHYRIVLGARDISGSDVVIKEWNMQILPSDVMNETNGPNNQGCGTGEPIDQLEFDNKFTCNCTGTGFSGANCELQDISEVTDSSTAVIVGVTISFLFLVVVIGLMYTRWYEIGTNIAGFLNL